MGYNIGLEDYLKLKGSINYVNISSGIGSLGIVHNKGKASMRCDLIDSFKSKIRRYGVVVFDIDTDIYFNGLNIFQTIVTDLIGLGDIVVITHTNVNLRRLLLYKELNNLKIQVYKVDRGMGSKDVKGSGSDGGMVLDDKGKLIVRLRDRVSTVSSDITVTNLLLDIDRFKCSSIEVDVSGVDILDISKFYTTLKKAYKDKVGIVGIDTSKVDMKLISSYSNSVIKSKVSLVQDILKGIELGTVVLLYSYDLGKRDRYKRRGNGVIVGVKVAIFRGISNSGELIFDIYDKVGLASGNYTTREIGISQIGFCNSFLGTNYHIELPIVESLDDIGNYSIGGGEQCLIGEYIQHKLNINKVDYNKTALASCISISYKNLHRLISKE